MTHTHNHQDSLLSKEMRRHRLSPPSPNLQKEALRAARGAWTASETKPSATSWSYPVFRFAAPLTIAMILLLLTNVADEHSLEKWKPSSERNLVIATGSIAENRPELSKLIATTESMPTKDKLQRLRNRMHEIHQAVQTLPQIDG